jgi:hypothetical protein
MKRRDLTPGREGGRGSKRIGLSKREGGNGRREKREDGDEDGRLREKRRR